jgi:NADPH-dependent F420 reductase
VSASPVPPARPLPDAAAVRIAVLGGTGPQGRGLARRFALAGHEVLLGSRDAGRAAEVATQIATSIDSGLADAGTVRGLDNAAAVAELREPTDVVIVAVPYDGHADLLRSLAAGLADRIVVDCVNPLGFDSSGAFALDVPEGSAAQQAAALLPDSRVVAAFHHVSAVLLEDPAVDEVATDVLVLGDDRDATDLVVALAGRVAGMRGVYAGRLRNARQIEALTANLISVNRRYKAHAGLRVTDV